MKLGMAYMDVFHIKAVYCMQKLWPWIKGQGHRQRFIQNPFWPITLVLMVG